MTAQTQRDRREFRLPTYTLWRPTGRTWRIVAHGSMDSLIALSDEGDEVRIAGDLPDLKDTGLRLNVF